MNTEKERKSVLAGAVRRQRREPTERMVRIHELLVAGECPNCNGLAERFEVSAKTITRDLEYMRDYMELPIAYDSRRYCYYYTNPAVRFPGAPSVTEAELFSLFVADKAIAQYQGTPFHRPLKMAFQKLTGDLDRKKRFSIEGLQSVLSFRPFAPEDTDLQTFETISKALQQCRMVEFSYRKPGVKDSELRTVNPYHLTCSDNRWYLLAHDVDRGDMRTFALGRLSEPVITDRRFIKPENFDPEKYLSGSFTVMKGEGDYEVVIEFDAWATDLVRGRKWHPSQQVTELPGGGSRMCLRLSGLEEIERWVLSWGTHAKVIGPSVLAQRLKVIVGEMVRRYFS